MGIENLETEFGITFTNNESTGQTAQEVYQEWLDTHCELVDGEWVIKQIDNCIPPPTNEELNNQLIQTQKLCLSLQKQILLK